MSFLEMAKNRYSERFFDPRPVEQEKLDKILEAGRVVPTACNYQPQRFYVLRSPEARLAAGAVATAPEAAGTAVPAGASSPCIWAWAWAISWAKAASFSCWIRSRVWYWA